MYDVSQRNEFIERNKTKDEVIVDFLNSFDGVKGSHDEVANFQVDVYISTKKFFTTKLKTRIEKSSRKIEKSKSHLWWKTSL